MSVSKKIMVLISVYILSVGLVGCSKSEESELNDTILEDEYTEDVVDHNKYEKDYERALDEYEGNMDSIEEDYEENRVINNGLKELSREEFVDHLNNNTVKIVLEGKIGDCRNFESTIRKEVAYFIKNREKYPSSEGYYLNIRDGIYAVHRRIEISADDMEMYALLEYGETRDGEIWIIFHATDNNITMKKIPETTEEWDEAARQDDELRRLLLDLEKSLNHEYGGMLHPN